MGTYDENTSSGGIYEPGQVAVTLVQLPVKLARVWSTGGLRDEAQNHILLIWVTPGALHSY